MNGMLLKKGKNHMLTLIVTPINNRINSHESWPEITLKIKREREREREREELSFKIFQFISKSSLLVTSY
jgi:hypothetical protein